MANGASELRERAKECRDLARRMERHEERERLEEMAKSWEELAAEARRKSSR